MTATLASKTSVYRKRNDRWNTTQTLETNIWTPDLEIYGQLRYQFGHRDIAIGSNSDDTTLPAKLFKKLYI